MHGRLRRIASSGVIATLLGSAMVVGAVTTASPAAAATTTLSSSAWAANLGGGNIVETAGIIALGAGGGSCTSLQGGKGASVVGPITLAATDTLVGYPGGLGSACGTPTGGTGGVDTDPNFDYRGGNGGLGFTDGLPTSIAETGAGGGAATTVYRNTSTKVAFAGGGGGAGGDGVVNNTDQAIGGTAGDGGGAAGTAGGNGSTFNGATGGNGGQAGFSPETKGKDATNASCTGGACGGPAGGGAGSNSSLKAGDGAATAGQAAGAGGGAGGASNSPGLTGVVYSAASSVAAGSASVTYIDITAGSVSNAAQGGTYSGTNFAADAGWTGLGWALDGACSGCSLPTGLAINPSTGAISGTVSAAAGSYTFDVVATGNPSTGPLTTFQLKTRHSVTMTVAPAAAPTFTSASSASATEGTAMTPFTVTTTGIPDATVSISGGSLPSGVSLTPGAGGTATISGTPASGTAGAHVVTLKAANAVNPDATQAFTLTVAPPPGTAQTAAKGCVTVGGTRSIPRRGTKQLMKPGCRTNAGKIIGVRVNSATPRGDQAYYSLYCQVSKNKTTKTSSTGYGDGSRYCKKGALRIRTYGYRLKLRISWFAPATGNYTTYKTSKTYLT